MARVIKHYSIVVDNASKDGNMVMLEWGVVGPLVTLCTTVAGAPLYELTISLFHCSITVYKVNPSRWLTQ